jgi:diacylglycerol kinase (ATP)
MRILIIANPSIGINKEKRAIITRIVEIQRNNGNKVDTAYSYKSGQGRKLAAIAVAEGYDTIYAAGGDGTVNDVATGLVNTGIPLGIIPLGTGNGLARGLGIPLETEAYIDVLNKQRTIAMDSGKIGPSTFFATAGIGFDSKIAHDFNAKFKSKRSIPAYIYLGVKHYFLGRPEKLSLTIDGKEYSRKLFALTIANTSQYGGGAIIAPQANPKSGKLIAIMIPKINPFKALSAVRKLFAGTADMVKDLEFVEFLSMKIVREKPGLYHVDGETHEGTARLNVAVNPGSLTVIVP